MERLLSCLSQRIADRLLRLPEYIRKEIEEIRIRINQPIEVVIGRDSFFLNGDGKLNHEPDGFIATDEDGQKIINLISRHSLYALEEELKKGYITIPGGHRVGIAGKVITTGHKVEMIKHIRFFNFRIARPVYGAAEKLLPYLLRDSFPLNTLIISPPRCGKTTLLRDLIRLLSTGWAGNKAGFRVGVVDERSEIAGSIDGVPQYDLGPRTDVLDGCPKAEGLMMLIRSMSPHIVACDEIGGQEDALAILEALHAGVKVVATAHGMDLTDISRRPGLKLLFDHKVMERFVILSHRQGAGTVEKILDQDEKPIYPLAKQVKAACLS